MSCNFRIEILNTDPDSRLQKGFNFWEKNHRKNLRKVFFSNDMKTTKFEYNSLILLNIKQNCKKDRFDQCFFSSDKKI